MSVFSKSNLATFFKGAACYAAGGATTYTTCKYGHVDIAVGAVFGLTAGFVTHVSLPAILPKIPKYLRTFRE